MTEMLDAALQYAGRGWYVFPIWPAKGGKCACGKPDCSPDRAGKHPKVKWKTGATTDQATIEKWWRRWPDAGIAIATGPSGLSVFDIDGPAGWDQFRAIVSPSGEPFETLAAQTRRGAHLYYRGDCPTSSRAGEGEMVDVRGVGGFVVAPPSLHASGFQYRWLNAMPAAPVPGALDAWSRARGRKTPARSARAAAVALLGARPAWLGHPTQESDSLAARAGIPPDPIDLDEIERALQTIPASCPMTSWIKVGMALKAAGLPFELWNEWSQEDPEKYKESEMEYRWSTFGEGEVGIGTLFLEAKKYGYAEGYHENVKTEANGVNGHATLPPHFAASPEKQIRFPDLNEDGKVRATCANTRAAIRKLGIECRHDIFHGKMLVGGHAIAQWAGELSDHAVLMLRVLVRREYGFDPGKEHAFDAAMQECLQHPFDPVRTYLDGLAWDGRPRLDSWLSAYMGATASALGAAIGRLALVAAVRRCRQPGCKFDQIIVFEGPEGRGKSSAIEILAGADNFSDQSILTLDDRGQQEAVRGVWLYEIADMAGHARSENERIKAFASRTRDRARPAYGRARVDEPRRCVFFATTNDESYLRSLTGNRRFWPVRTGAIDLEGLARDRDQLWAEAAHIEAQGAPITLDGKLWGAVTELQASRQEHDPWEDALTTIKVEPVPGVYGMEMRVTSQAVLDLWLEIPKAQQNHHMQKRIAFLMRRLGWDGPKLFKTDGKPVRGYSIAVTGATGATKIVN